MQDWNWCKDAEIRKQIEAAWKAYEKSGKENDLYKYFQLVEGVPDELLAKKFYFFD